MQNFGQKAMKHIFYFKILPFFAKKIIKKFVSKAPSHLTDFHSTLSTATRAQVNFHQSV